MGNTRGIHWIVTTHGSWLHGDPRGSWRDGKLIGPDPFLESTIRQRMRHDAVVLDTVEQIMRAGAFGELCVERGWRVYAATVQPTHCHIVFAPLPEPVNDVIAALKYRGAAKALALRRQMRRPTPRSLWTGGKFPVFIFDDDHLRNAIEYVRRHNHRAGRLDDPYPWIDALGWNRSGKPNPEGSAI